MSDTTVRTAEHTYLVVGGFVYLLVWIYALAIDKQSGADVVPLNNTDDWLHLVLGVGTIALGLIVRHVAVSTTRADGPSYG